LFINGRQIRITAEICDRVPKAAEGCLRWNSRSLQASLSGTSLTHSTMPKYEYIQAVVRAADILELVANNPHGLSLRDLTTALNLPRQTIYNLLRTLVHKGLLIKNGRPPRYELGWSLAALRSKQDENNRRLIKRAVPVMLRLARRTGADAILSQYTGGEVVGRIRATPEPDEEPVLRYSWRMGPYCNGLLFQAWMEPAEQAEYRVRNPLSQYDIAGYWQTIDAVNSVVAHLPKEPFLAYMKSGILRVLVPVMGNGELLAAVGLYKQSVLACSDCGARECVKAAREAADELSQMISFRQDVSRQTYGDGASLALHRKHRAKRIGMAPQER